MSKLLFFCISSVSKTNVKNLKHRLILVSFTIVSAWILTDVVISHMQFENLFYLSFRFSLGILLHGFLVMV